MKGFHIFGRFFFPVRIVKCVRRILLVILLFLSYLPLQGQGSGSGYRFLDSMIAVCNSYPDQDHIKLGYYNIIAREYVTLNPVSGLNYSKKAIDLSGILNDSIQLITAASNMAANLLRSGRWQEADTWLSVSLQISESLEYPQGEIDYEIGRGVYLSQKKDTAMALQLLNSAIEKATKYGYSRLKADASLQMAVLHRATFDSAIFWVEKAWLLYNELKHEKDLAIVSQLWGNIYNNHNQFPEAVSLYNQSIGHARLSGMHSTEATIHYIMGKLYIRIGNYIDAVNSLEQGETVASKLADTGLLVSILISQGEAYSLTGNFEESVSLYSRAVQLNNGRNLRLAGSANFQLSRALARVKRHADAIQPVKISLDLTLKQKLYEQAGLCECHLSTLFLELNQLDSALYHALECNKLIVKYAKNPQNRVFALNAVGFIYNELNLDSAALYFETATKIAEKINDPVNLLVSYDRLIKLYRSLGKRELEKKYIMHQMNLASELNYQYHLLYAYNDFGEYYLAQGIQDTAIMYYDSAINMAMALAYFKPIAGFLRNKARLYSIVGDFIKAINAVHEAIRIDERQGSDASIYMSYSRLIEAYYEIGDYHRAIEYSEKAAEGHLKTGNTDYAASAYVNMGLCYSELGMDSLALRCYLRGDELHQIGSNAYFRADHERNMASIYIKWGEFEKADSLITNSIRNTIDFNDIEGLISSYHTKANLEYKRGRPDSSIKYLNSAVKLGAPSIYQPRLLEVFQLQHAVYATMGFYDSALISYHKYNYLNDSFLNEKMRNEITRLELQFQYETKEAEYLLKEKLANEQLKSKEQELLLLKRRNELNRGRLQLKTREFRLLSAKRDAAEAMLLSQAIIEEKHRTEKRMQTGELAMLGKQRQLQQGLLTSRIAQRNAIIAGIVLLSLFSFFVYRNMVIQKRLSAVIDEKNKDLNTAIHSSALTQEEIIETEKQKKMAWERSRISRDLHDEVGSGLTRIAMITELMLKDPGDSVKEITKISDTAVGLLDNMSEIVRAIKTENEALGDLFGNLRKYCLDFFENTGIQCTVSVDQTAKSVLLPGSVRRNIELVIKETLHNIVKYAGACNVALRITAENEQVIVEIHEDGKGFDVEKSGTMGNGLRNMEKRMRDIDGSFELKSVSGKGSTTRISAFWSKSKLAKGVSV